MSENLRQKIIDIICQEWPTPDGYLLGSYIYERLRREGVNVTDHVLNDELAGLAGRADNPYAGAPRRHTRPGSCRRRGDHP
jgi:plasmid stabilization system protein ParE